MQIKLDFDLAEAYSMLDSLKVERPMPKDAPYVRDLPPSDDLLRFSDFLPALSQLLVDAKTPLTVGVFGPWGSGKTTLLKRLKDDIDQRHDTNEIRTLWFTAWKFDRESALWRTFILRVIDALYPRVSGDEPWEERPRLEPDDERSAEARRIRNLERLEESVYRSVEWQEAGRLTAQWSQLLPQTAQAAGILAAAFFPGAELVQKILKSLAGKDQGDPSLVETTKLIRREVRKYRLEQLASMEQFERTFREVLKDALGPRGRLVVFIDDLDRCLPEKSIEVLEAIKLFVAVEGAIFVLGADASVIERGIEVRYKVPRNRPGESPISGAEYLEKIIQIPFYLPVLGRDNVETFIDSMAPKDGAGEQVLTEMTRKVFAHGVRPNPRQAKRVLNIFLLLRQIALERERRGTLPPELIAWPLLIKTILIQTQWPNLYQEWRLEPRLVWLLEEQYERRLQDHGDSDESGEASVVSDDEEGSRDVEGPPQPLATRRVLNQYLEGGRANDLLAKMLLFPSEKESGTGRDRARFSQLKDPKQLSVYVRLAGAVETPLHEKIHPRSEPPGEIMSDLEVGAAEPAPARRVEITRLPGSGPYFVAREDELRRLDRAWDDPHENVLSIVAWGGVGKTALVNHWLALLAQDDYRGAEDVYAWSFYSQGTKERLTSADQFIDQALRFFGDEDPTAGSPHDRGVRLAGLVRRRRTLLVLDGVEPLQHPPGPLAGQLKDPGLKALVKSLASSNPGLCVATTREPLDDITHLADTTAPRLDLSHLTEEGGAHLLRRTGVQGTERELRKAAKYLGGHALAISLLGTYLVKALGGDVRRIREIPFGKADKRKGGHAYRVMASYEKWLGEREMAVLSLLGLFDRPADGDAIAALRAKPVIPELNESLVELAEDDWQWTVSNLRKCGLLAASDVPGTLDTHPLVRAYFGDRLAEHHPDTWRAGQSRLYEHFKGVAKELPETIEEMMPLYAAIAHGCRAGRQKESLEVFRCRIQRGSKFYSSRKLGASGSDLSALAGFFDRPWEGPSGNLSATDCAFVLSEAGYNLRALGRLIEAVQPTRAALELRKAQEDWGNAAINAGNLSELFLTLGDIAEALRCAEESVESADRGGNSFFKIICRAKLGDALHQAGRLDHSLAAFREAEAMQAVRQPHYPRLYSVQGYRFCELQSDSLLELLARAQQTLDWVLIAGQDILSIALDHLTLGRAFLNLALEDAKGSREASFESAADYLHLALDGFRKAGDVEFVARGLLARAALRRVTGDLIDARADLAEAQEIAEGGHMLLLLADIHLEWARIWATEKKVAEAGQHVAEARRLVEECGYYRRRRDVQEIELELG